MAKTEGRSMNEKIIKKLIIVLLILSVIPLIGAHSIDKKEETLDSKEYEISLETKPKYPVTGKTTELLFTIHTERGHGEDLKVISKIGDEEVIAKESGHDTYKARYEFDKSGNKSIDISIDGEKVGALTVQVDSFGKKGWISTLVLIFFTFIILFAMYKDLR